MRRFAALLFLTLAPSVNAEDSPLARLREILLPLRSRALGLPARGATPEFTTVKHMLRDWVESRICSLGQNDDPDPLVRALNEELSQAGLLQSEPARGFLAPIRISRHPELLLTTGVGIDMCGSDESAYMYEWKRDRWQRLWQSEQNDYTDQAYAPQSIDAVRISSPSYEQGADRSERLVLTLGHQQLCSSNWHDIYYRVWQIKASYPEPKLLLSGSEFAYVSSDFAVGAVRPNEVLIEYVAASIDGWVHSRRQIRHYVLEQGRLIRTHPLVLSPRDFVDEWLRLPWREAVCWTGERQRAALQRSHKSWTGDLRFGEFISTLHCEQQPDRWQVGIAPDSGPETGPPLYYLVRWRPPYDFTMVGVSDHPRAGCTETDRRADETRTLFPGQTSEWR